MAAPVKRRLFSDQSMGTVHEVVEIDPLERALLPESHGGDDGKGGGVDDDEDKVIYTAPFDEMEEKFVKYQTTQWVLYSLVLVLAWGIGLLMLLYLPIRRYVLRKDIQSRKLFLTPNAIVYKVTKPVAFPCFGVLQKEKHVLLSSVADIIIEQGYLQSLFGMYSVRIENVGVRRPPSDDVQIQGVANPRAFKKAVLTRLSQIKNDIVSRQIPAIEDVPNLRLGPPSPWMSPMKYQRQDSLPTSSDLMLLQKLEEVGNSVKRVQTLMEEQGQS